MALHPNTTKKSTIFFLSSKHFNLHVSSVALYKHIIPTHFSYSIISLKRELKPSHRDTMGQLAKTVFFVFVFLAQMKEWQNIVLNDIIR